MDSIVGRGKHTALTGLCNRVWHDQERPGPPGGYDTEAELGFFENYLGFRDRPCTKITNCLREVFGLEYDASLGRYEVRVGAAAHDRAAGYLEEIGCRRNDAGRYNCLITHYSGNTSPGKKNLAHWQAKGLFDLAKQAGRKVVLLDWDKRCPFADGVGIFTPRTGEGDIWGGFGSGDAETIAALIAQAEAYVGIDSGPGKVASATDTPSLICWIGHHPLQFHDPAPNTTHLIPADHRRMPPVENDQGRWEYFEKHYRFTIYTGPHGLVSAARSWLGGVLNHPVTDPDDPPFVLPQGIGDAVWALLKAKSLRPGRPVDIVLAGDPASEVGRRAVPFVKRFGFVRDVTVLDVPYLEDREHPADAQGRYRYVPDGVRHGYHYLMPNRTLEEGRRLEEWLPEVPLDWSVLDDFSWEGTERGDELGKSLEPFACFYLGPESGNVDEGHNRGFLWEPRDWVLLGKLLERRGVKVVVIGASYDRSYWERYVKEGVREQDMQWLDLIGRTDIGECFALIRRAKCLVAYQSGLAVFAHYLGVPVVTWWRPEGNSCHAEYPVSFSEEMRNAWTKPDVVAAGKYMGLVYKAGETPGDIAAEMVKRGWLDESVKKG